VEKNPDTVSQLGAELRQENWRFRSFVQTSAGLTPARIDGLAKRLGREAEAQMNCRECGACCRDNCIPLTDDEIDRLAARLNLDNATFREHHITLDEDGVPALDAMPCPFLEDRQCAIYEDRPEPCRGYPYLGGSFMSRSVGIIERAEVCPIVFDMLERLKEQTGFRRCC
jgi:Fe-S-cluster containining protein